MEKQSRVLVWVILVAVMASILIGSSSLAMASGSTKAYSNGYEYTVSEGKATITGYTGTAVVISIPSTLGGYPVVAIGKWAFDECDNLMSVTMQNGVTSIGWGAFQYCTSLVSVVIPISVTSIESWAFAGCTNLMSVTIPNGVTSIEDYIFSYCTNLKTIIIPNGMKDIGSCAFEDCKSLENITIPNSVTSIGDYAFKNCISLKSINIPNSVTSIEDYLFYGCTGLKTITIPNSVTSIGSYTFKNCDSLTDIAIPNSVTSIGSCAFSDCDSLTDITIPNSVTSIGTNAFYTCAILENIYVDDGNVAYTSQNGILYSNDKTILIMYPHGKKGSFDVPASVKNIRESAFDGCHHLTSIRIPNSVTGIGDCAFSNCNNLESITIPDSVTSIGDCAFWECESLKSITLSGNLTRIEESLFWGSGLESITIPSGVTSIGSNAFQSCRQLRSVMIPNSVTSIASCTFEYCVSLSSITIPDSMTSIDQLLFSGSGLVSISIPNSVTFIGSHAFKDCENLESIIIPNSVTSFGSYVFDYCEKLTIYGNEGSRAQGYAATNHIPFTVLMEPAIDSITCDKSSAIIGDSATYTINATGGVAPLYYCFYVYKDSTAVHKGSYSASNTFTYTFPSAGSYKVQGYVRDKIDAKVAQYSAVIVVAAPDPPVITSVTCNKTSAAVGDSATWTIDATGGQAPLSYCFYVYKDSVAVYKGSYTTSNAYTYTFPSAGSYKVLGYVKDASSMKVTKYSDVINVVPAPLAITSVTCNKTSAAVGDSATWTISATGGKAPLAYCFYVYQGSTAIYKGSYSASNTYAYAFTSAGSYKVQGYAKDSNNAKVSKYSAVINVTASASPVITSVTCNKTSAVISDSATWTINATGGKAPLSYCFYVFKDGVAVYKGSYSASNTYTYTFTSSGSYKVQGYVRDSVGTKISKYSAVINVTASASLIITSVTCNKASVAIGESATYTLNATGGKAPRSYCFYVYKDGVAVHKGVYGTYNKYTYTFTSAGNYKVQGYVKDANNAKVCKYSAAINVTAPAPLAITSVTCNKTSTVAGDSASYTINVVGGKAPLSYCFYVYRDGIAVYKGTYGASNTYSYTFQSAGNYKVQGYVKDAANAKVSKYSSIVIVNAP